MSVISARYALPPVAPAVVAVLLEADGAKLDSVCAASSFTVVPFPILRVVSMPTVSPLPLTCPSCT